jgi:anti-sigma factor RsiW
VNAQHLSDEAVAACADGVLTGHARERATRHVESCAECRTAVQVQREAAWALRAAPAPALPNSLADRLRSVPLTTPITTLPTVVAPDGSTMLATFAPAAAFVPTQSPKSRRTKPFITTAAVVALAGALTAGSVARDSEAPQTGSGSTVHAGTPVDGNGGGPAVVRPVSVFRAHQP